MGDEALALIYQQEWRRSVFDCCVRSTVSLLWRSGLIGLLLPRVMSGHNGFRGCFLLRVIKYTL